jgi:hypothetical protein
MSKTVNYSNSLATTEITSLRSLKRDGIDLTYKTEDNMEQQIKKSMISFSGLFPFICDFITNISTNHNKAITRSADDYYSVKIPYDKFLDLTLGEHKKYRGYLLDEINSYRNKSQKELEKVIIDPRTHEKYHFQPLIINYMDKDYKVVSPERQKHIDTLNKNGNREIEAITGVQILFHKILFEDVVENNGANYFPCPAYFQSTVLDSMERCKNDKDIVFDKNSTATSFRKLFFYMNLHDNNDKTTNIKNMDAVDLLLQCAPQYVQCVNDKYYINSWWDAREYVRNGLILFRKMAEYGYMQGTRFSPTGVYFDKTTKKYNISVTRKQNEYRNHIKFITQSL